MTVFTARFSTGEPVTRRSAAPYAYASRDSSGRVRFHADRSAAPSGAEVVEVRTRATFRRGCIVCANEPVPGRISERTASGETRVSDCYGCAR